MNTLNGLRYCNGRHRVSRQHGLGLATALFVITVMALMAVLVMQLVRTNAETGLEQFNLVRSFYTAHSGVEYGLNRAFPPDGTASQCPAFHDSTTTFVPATLELDGLNQCTMEISCQTLIVGGDNYYTITSTGTCGDVARTIQVRAK